MNFGPQEHHAGSSRSPGAHTETHTGFIENLFFFSTHRHSCHPTARLQRANHELRASQTPLPNANAPWGPRSELMANHTRQNQKLTPRKSRDEQRYPARGAYEREGACRAAIARNGGKAGLSFAAW